MPCDKVNCDLKQACFEVYGKFSYPPCASEQGESPATDRQQLKAAIALLNRWMDNPEETSILTDTYLFVTNSATESV